MFVGRIKMKLRKVTRDVLSDFKGVFSKDSLFDFWEFKESFSFYKQSIRDFLYASKVLIRALLGIFLLIISPLLIPFAIAIRYFNET